MTDPLLDALVAAASAVLGVEMSTIPDRHRALRELATRRAAEDGHDGPKAWAATLNDPAVLRRETDAFIDAVTVGFTYFGRDSDQLAALALALAELRRPVRIWSAGCSSGEETWTVAMALSMAGVPAELVGTDVDPTRLSIAQNAVYARERVLRLDDERRSTFFADVDGGRVRLAEGLRRCVSFQRHNLSDQPPLPGPWDAIVCRNVLMYFTDAASRRVLQGFERVLNPGGLVLFAGHEVPRVPTWARRDVGALIAWAPSDVGAQPRIRPIDRLAALQAELATPVRQTTPFRSDPARVGARPTTRRTGASPRVTPRSVPRVARPSRAEEPLAPSGGAHGAGVLVERANAALAVHRWDEALDGYTAALSLEPGWPEIHYMLGVLHRKIGDLGSAERALKRALFIDDRYWPAAWMLAGILASSGRAEAGRRLRAGARTDAAARPADRLCRVEGVQAWIPTEEQLAMHAALGQRGRVPS